MFPTLPKHTLRYWRALQIAIELGREGWPFGAIFAFGDYKRVAKFCRQMVINPCRGYRDDEKSIMDPFLEESVKEFATIKWGVRDTGDGVFMSAGVFLKPEKVAAELLAGLGARHTAAAAIMATTAAFSFSLILSKLGYLSWKGMIHLRRKLVHTRRQAHANPLVVSNSISRGERSILWCKLNSSQFAYSPMNFAGEKQRFKIKASAIIFRQKPFSSSKAGTYQPI